MSFRYKCQPDLDTCVHACIAMIADVSVKNVIRVVGHDRPCTEHAMRKALRHYGFGCRVRGFRPAKDMPDCAILLFLETSRYGHAAVLRRGKVYDPLYGIDADYPPRRSLKKIAVVAKLRA